ncbi:MAG: nucleotide pyrophosphohydrolase [Gammaproteobacteria bacterium]
MTEQRSPWLESLAEELAAFAEERDWTRFHNPKNLAMALAAEAGELLEEFQWLDAEESQAPDAARRARIEAEMADVLIYLVRLADRLGTDLPSAVSAKVESNRRKYPVDQVRGDHRKYNQY